MTVVGVVADSGRARLDLVGGNLAPRVVTLDARGAKVALVATTALLLGGDTVDLRLRVGPGAWLEIVETAGTVAYDADGAASSWNVEVVVEAGGLLLWHGEPFVVSDGANTRRRSHYDLHQGATLCVRETLVLGRAGERGGAVRLQNRICADGTELLVEELDLRDPTTRELPGIIGGHAVIDTVTLIGSMPTEHPELPVGNAFRLDGDVGTVGRALLSDLARSPAPDWWASWSAVARSGYLLSDRR